ncbi:hypothetical protein EsH8_V_000070 [Colletotrichum jinshuiense]
MSTLRPTTTTTTIMAKESLPKRVLMQKGFAFPPGPIFPDDGETIRRVLSAIFGDEQLSAEIAGGLNYQAQHALTDVFHVLLDRTKLYIAVRGHSVFYDTVALELRTRGGITAEIVKILDDSYTEARRQYHQGKYQQGKSRITDLAVTVDAWIRVRDVVAELPALQTISLAVRSDNMGALTSGLENTSINDSDDAGGGSEPSWPPAYFAPKDAAIISSKNLRARLVGKTPQTPGSLPPLPTKNTLPTETRVFLCSLLLMNYQPTSTWKLAPAPVAQMMNTQERWLWSDVSGGESCVCFSVDVFAKEAAGALRSGKDLYIALATPWFGRTWGSIPSIAGPLRGAVDITTRQALLWSSLCPRLGFAIVLHRYADGFELVIFDPIARYDHVKSDPNVKASMAFIFAFRQAVRDETERAVQEVGGRLVRGWYGGRLGAVADGTDSVQLCSEWIHGLVADGRDRDPLAVADDVWAQWGFEEIQM